MQPIPAPHLIGARARTLVVAVLLAAALMAVLSQVRTASAPAPTTSGLALVGGMPLQQARCSQWLAAGPAERSAALSALQGVVGGSTTFGQATTLTRAEAERLFDRTCAQPFAQNFLLYELYTRASGFRSLSGP